MLLNAYKVNVTYELNDGSMVGYSTVVGSSCEEYAQQVAECEGQDAWGIWNKVVAYHTDVKKLNYMIVKEEY